MLNLRQKKIQEYIEANSMVTIAQLRELVPDVSLMTIHRDLDMLAERGAVVKVRGGARSVHHNTDISFDIRMLENNSGKKIIAKKALSLIEQNSTIFLDSSTSNLVLARNLPDIPLNIFTTSPSIAIELCRLHNPTVTVCCGTMNRKNMAISGQNTLEMLSEINIDLAFIGVSGCSAEVGFTCGTEADKAVKRTAIRKARISAMMCDHSKFSRLMPHTFARFENVNYLISDEPVPQAIVRAAKTNDVIIL